jgi:hyperosmotically inducible periplasmic protein
MRTFIALALVVLGVAGSAHAVTFTDAWTAARAKVAVLADARVVGDDVPGITVDADGSRVRLRGDVASDDARQAADAAARSVRGVTAVDNELRIVPRTATDVLTSDDDLRKLVAQSLRVFRRPGLGGRTVAVDVRDGIATLTGEVSDITDWTRASERARQVAGIKAVDNRLWVKELKLSAR